MTTPNRVNGAETATAPAAPAQAPQPQRGPTHGAVELGMLSALLKHFKETPMAHDISDPFVQYLSTLQLITLTPQELAQ